MPKIIANLKEDILATAEKQIAADGFGAFSLRRLGKELHIAPATIYNYYDSKEQILGEVITKRWLAFLDHARQIEQENIPIIDGLSLLSDALAEFMQPLLSYFSKNEERQDLVAQRNHVLMKKKAIFTALNEIIIRMLIRNGKEKEVAEKISSPLTKMLILSGHDKDIDFKELIFAIQKLQ